MCYQPLSVPETNEGTDGQPGLGLAKYEPWWSIKKLEQARLHLCREPTTEQTVRTNPQTHSSREPVWKPEREQTQTTQLFSPETHPESPGILKHRLHFNFYDIHHHLHLITLIFSLSRSGCIKTTSCGFTKNRIIHWPLWHLFLPERWSATSKMMDFLIMIIFNHSVFLCNGQT